MKKIFCPFLICFLFLTTNPGNPQRCCAAAGGSTAGAFLKIPMGSRPVSMGEAFVAIADDSNALGWNPGGLDLAKTGEVNFTHLEWLAELRCESVSYLQPLGRLGSIGLSGIWLPVWDIPRTDDNKLIDIFTAADSLVQIGYGKKLGRGFGIGFAGKYVQERIDKKRITAFAGDFGILGTFAQGKIRLGGCVQNLGNKLTFIDEKSPLPVNFKLGVSFAPRGKRMVVSFGTSQELKGNSSVEIGGELWFSRWLAFRMGYRHKPAVPSANGLNGLRAGLGLKIASELGTGVKIDYALAPYGDLGLTHRISLGMTFGARAAEEEVPVAPLERMVAIADFKSINISPAEAIFISNLLRTALKEVPVISKQEQSEILNREFPEGFKVLDDPKKAAQLGKTLDTEKVIIGSCKRLANLYTIAIGIIDVHKGKVIYTDTVDEIQSAEIGKGVKTLAKGILKYFAKNEAPK